MDISTRTSVDVAGAKKALASFLKKLERAGVTLIDRKTSKRVAQLEEAIAGASDLSLGINDWEKIWPFADMELRDGERFSPNFRKAVLNGTRMTVDSYIALLKKRDHARDVLMGLAGDVDASPNTGAGDALDRLKADPKLKVVVGNTEGETILAMNNKKAPLDDVRVRQALEIGYDRDAIAQLRASGAAA